MTPKPLLIAIVCGLAAALAFVSPLSLGALGIVLSTFTALPLFISALGFGTLAGIISGGIAAAIIAVFFGITTALMITAATLAPALIIGHLTGLMRNDEGAEEWYPLSGILMWMILICIAITIAIMMLSGYSSSWAEQQALETLRLYYAAISTPGAPAPDEAVLVEGSKTAANLFPLAMPASFLFFMVLNLHIAMRIARANGWVLRPKDNVSAQTALPLWIAGLLAVSIALIFVGGALGLAAKVVAGAVGFGFLLVGLATVHFLVRSVGGHGSMLILLYVMLLYSQAATIAVALLGVSETLFGLRARRAARPPST